MKLRSVSYESSIRNDFSPRFGFVYMYKVAVVALYCIVLYRVASRRVVSCRVASLRIVSCRVASYRVVSRRVVSSRVVYFYGTSFKKNILFDEVDGILINNSFKINIIYIKNYKIRIYSKTQMLCY